MAVQSEIFSTEYGVRSFISTKHIATKQNMAVWLQRVSDDVWIQLSQSNYELINNSAVLTTAPNLATYSKVEIRVADTPDELTPSPSEISIIADNIGSINIVAENITDINDVSDSIENVNIIASYTDNIDINANNIDDINVTAEAIRGGGTVYDTIKLSYSIDTVDDFTSVPEVYTTAIVKDSDRGGIFHWSATGVANGGTVFAGATGYWNRQYSGAVNVKWFGAKGDGVADDSVAIQKAIDFCHTNDLGVYFDSSSYVINKSIYTQDGNNPKLMYFYFDKTKLIANFSGSAALIVKGGAYFQRFEGSLLITPTNTYKMLPDFSNKDSVSHGLEIQGTRYVGNADISVSQMTGFGIHIIANGNGNRSNYNFYAELCSTGVFCSGSQDDLAVCTARISTASNADYGFYSSPSTPIRGWEANIYAENNHQVNNTPIFYQIEMHKAINSTFYMYAESYNDSMEIGILSYSTGNTIFSSRNNLDTYVNGNIAIVSGEIKKLPLNTFTPTVIGSSVNGTADYTSQVGVYQKVGNFINYMVKLSWINGTGSGNLEISGLPGLVTGSSACSIGSFDIAGLTLGSMPMAVVDENRKIRLFKNTAGSTNFIIYQPSGSVIISGSYLVA